MTSNEIVPVDPTQALELTDDYDAAQLWEAWRTAYRLHEAAKERLDQARAELDEAIGDHESITADGRELAGYHYDGQFSSKRFSQDLPHLAERYTQWRPESYIDQVALERDHPVLYKQYRARTLRVTKEGK